MPRLQLGVRVGERREYGVVGYLGGGSYSEVYQVAPVSDADQARWRLGTPLALKIPGGNRRWDRRWDWERDALDACGEDVHVIRLHEVIRIDNPGYKGPGMVMDRVPGGRTLGDVLPPRQERWVPWRYLRFLERAAKATAHLHARGFVHCDLKPANLGVMPDDSPRVLDLGSVERMGGRALSFSPTYAPPQQMHPLAPGWDLWAHGAILYECVVGRTLSEDVNARKPGLWPEEAEARSATSVQCLLHEVAVLGASLPRAVQAAFSFAMHPYAEEVDECVRYASALAAARETLNGIRRP